MDFKEVNISELDAGDRELMDHASRARERAYAKYSGFSVGAAVLLVNGEIIEGSNQENAAYPSGLCAERVAVFYASSRYPGVGIKSVAVVAGKNHEVAASPCGSCRQVLLEYEVKQQTPFRVLFRGRENKVIISSSASVLLPFPFSF